MRAVQIAGLLAALVSVSPAAAWSGTPNPQCGAATGLACPDKQALEKCIADNAEVTEHGGKVTVKLVNNDCFELGDNAVDFISTSTDCSDGCRQKNHVRADHAFEWYTVPADTCELKICLYTADTAWGRGSYAPRPEQHNCIQKDDQLCNLCSYTNLTMPIKSSHCPTTCTTDSDCPADGCRTGVCRKNGTCRAGPRDHALCKDHGCRAGFCKADGTCRPGARNHSSCLSQQCRPGFCKADGTCRPGARDDSLCPDIGSKVGVCKRDGTCGLKQKTCENGSTAEDCGCPADDTQDGKCDADNDPTACPGLDTLDHLSKTDTYDPTLVDWRSVKKSFEFIADQEPRFCNFAIRAHFHDAGSLSAPSEAPSVRGSDGSLMLDKFEFLRPANAYDAFGLYVRTVLTEFARFYGASFADLQNVAAFTCVEALGADVDIPEACAKVGLDLKVGKLDADFGFKKDTAAARVNTMPGPFQSTPVWLEFWLNKLNAVARPGYQFTVGESLALMGSHTLIDNQACTTDGEQVHPTPGIPGQGCKGEREMFKWTNSYFKNVMSGRCTPRNHTPKEAEWFVTTMENSKGRAPNDVEDPQLLKCTFRTTDGLKLGQNLECVAHNEAAKLGIGAIPEDNDFRFVDWIPDEHRAPCCGYHCQTCPGGLGPDAEPYYCANNSPAGTSMWFYTWQDCDMIYATRDKAMYCKQPFANCGAYDETKGGSMHTKLGEMADAYAEFQSNSKSWQTEYAYGHCKLNDLGARWSAASNGGVDLMGLLGRCAGQEHGDTCDTDPDPHTGVVNKVGGCPSPCNDLDVSQIISGSRCDSCSMEGAEAVEVPEVGELKPGYEMMVDGKPIKVAGLKEA